MAIDMRLISVKDGGKFAMSWVAGTNPKALRSNSQRCRVYSVDVPEVCEDMMETMKTKKNRLSFRILFKLCFGTIHIYAEQVQHLYNVTLNYFCFNTFALKQYSRKRLGSTITNTRSKRTRLESSEDLDIRSLLLESEVFNNYSEKTFKFPNDVGARCEKKQNTSTCIQIKEITIREISWDNPQPEEDEGFGEATQQDVMMLLSELNGTYGVNDILNDPKSHNRKRKSSFETTYCSPSKRSSGVVNESIDEIRCAPSLLNETMSEFSIDCSNVPLTQVEKTLPDCNENYMTQEELISALKCDLSQCPPAVDQILESQAVSDLNEMHIPEAISIQPPKKQRRSHLIRDTVTKLLNAEMEAGCANIWRNCHNYDLKEHVACIQKVKRQDTTISKTLSPRFQSMKLLFRPKNNFKSRMQQHHHINRELLLREILGDEYQIYKNDFQLKSNEGRKTESRKAEHTVEAHQSFPKSVKNDLDEPVYKDYSKRNGCHESNEITKDVLSLKCPLDEIDPYSISFDFPVEAGKQRSDWGKEGVLLKLLLAWVSKDSNINMNTIIVGASRINAALAFHTLLDLAGLQYIKIVKDQHNAIASINMGPEMIRKINEKLSPP